jgi:F-type H+-transporting ATPase subunit b
MKRDRWNRRAAPAAVFFVCAVAASNAAASEGQLVLLPDPKTLGFLVALFAALIYPVNALILKPIFRVFDERHKKISGTRRQAERLADATEELLGRYELSVREARAEAERDRKQELDGAHANGAAAKAEARTEAEGQVKRARREIAEALEDARRALDAESEGLALEIASQALGRKLS